MKLKQLSLFLENKPGAINDPCQCLADAGISISTLTLADTKYFGVLRLLIRDWEKAKRILEEKGFVVKLVDVVAIEIDHTPGSLARVLDVFREVEIRENGINVEYLYAFPAGLDGRAVIIFCFDDPDEAVRKLSDVPGIVLVDGDALFRE